MTIYTEMEKLLDKSRQTDKSLTYSIEIMDKGRCKLVGVDDSGYRMTAYFTTDVMPARQAIRMDYLMKKESAKC